MVNETVLNSVRNILTSEMEKEEQTTDIETSNETVFISALSRSLCCKLRPAVVLFKVLRNVSPDIHKSQRGAPKGSFLTVAS